MKTLQIMLRHRVAPIKARSAARPMCTWVVPTEYDRTPYEALTEKWRTFDQTMAEARSQKEGPLRWSPPSFRNEAFLAMQMSQGSKKSKGQGLKQQLLTTEPQRRQDFFQNHPKPLHYKEIAAANTRQTSETQVNYMNEVRENEVPLEQTQQLTLNNTDTIATKTLSKSVKESIPAEQPTAEDYQLETSGKKKFSKDIGVRKVSFVDEPTTIYFSKNYEEDEVFKKPYDYEQNEPREMETRKNQGEENIRSIESPQKDPSYYVHAKQFPTAEDSGNRMIKETQGKGILEPNLVHLTSRMGKSSGPSSKHESKRTVSTKIIRRNTENTSRDNDVEFEKKEVNYDGNHGQSHTHILQNKKTKALKRSSNDNIAQLEESKTVVSNRAIKGDNDISPEVQYKTGAGSEGNPSQKHQPNPEKPKKPKTKKHTNQNVKMSKSDKPVKEEPNEENYSKKAKKIPKESATSKQNTLKEIENRSSKEYSNVETKNIKNQPSGLALSETPSESLNIEEDNIAHHNDPIPHKSHLANDSFKVTPIKKAKIPMKKPLVQEMNDDFLNNEEQASNIQQLLRERSVKKFNARPSVTAEEYSKDTIFNRRKYDDLRKYIAEAEVELRVQKQMFNSQRNELKKRLRKLALNPLTEIEKKYKNPFQQTLESASRKAKDKPLVKRHSKVDRAGINNPESLHGESENTPAPVANQQEYDLMASQELASLNQSALSSGTEETDKHFVGIEQAEPLGLSVEEVNFDKSNAAVGDNAVIPHANKISGSQTKMRQASAISTTDSGKGSKKSTAKTQGKQKQEVVNYANLNDKLSPEHESPSTLNEGDFMSSAQINSPEVNLKRKVSKSALFDYYAEGQPKPAQIGKRNQLLDETPTRDEGIDPDNIKLHRRYLDKGKEQGTKSLTELENTPAVPSKFRAKRVQPSIARPILNEFKKKYPQQSMSKREYSTPQSTNFHSENKFAASTVSSVNQLINQNNLLRDSLRNFKQVESENNQNHWTDIDLTQDLNGLSHYEGYYSQPQALSVPKCYSESQNQIKNHGAVGIKSQFSQVKTKNNRISSISPIDSFDKSLSENSLHVKDIDSKKFSESSSKQSLKTITKQTPSLYNPNQDVIGSFESSLIKNELSEPHSENSSENIQSKIFRTTANAKSIDSLSIEELPHLKVLERPINNTSTSKSSTSTKTLRKTLNKRSANNESEPSLASLREQYNMHSFSNVEYSENDPTLNINIRKPTVKPKKSLETSRGSETIPQKRHKADEKYITTNSDNRHILHSEFHPHLEENPPHDNSRLENKATERHSVLATKSTSEKPTYDQALSNSPSQTKGKNKSYVEDKQKEHQDPGKLINVEKKSENEKNIIQEQLFNSSRLKKGNESTNLSTESTKPFISSHLYSLKNDLPSEPPITGTSEHMSAIRQVHLDLDSTPSGTFKASAADNYFPHPYPRRKLRLFEKMKPPPTPEKPHLPKSDALRTNVGSTYFNVKNLDSIFRIDESTHLPGLPIKKWKAPPTERAIYVASIPQPSDIS